MLVWLCLCAGERLGALWLGHGCGRLVDVGNVIVSGIVGINGAQAVELTLQMPVHLVARAVELTLQ